MHYEKVLNTLRTSRANPSMLDSIFVDAYGAKTPLNQLGNISVQDASTITIQIWDSSLIKSIESAIKKIFEEEVVIFGAGRTDAGVHAIGQTAHFDIKNKSFDQIFPKEWVNKVIRSEIDCDSIGWRGFMISEGLIWYDKTEKGDWTIVSINGANQESFQHENFIGWKTKKGIIPTKTTKKRPKKTGMMPRELWHHLLDEWTEEIGEKPFFGGDSPHIVDLAVFGYMQSIEMHSKAFRLIENHSKGMLWFNRMRNSVVAQ